jgi:ADP-ribose pyrophosphatase
MTQGKHTIAEGRFTRYVMKDGWEYVERKNTSGIVAIVAVTDDKKWILVEQFRKPVGSRVIELPAGLAGDVSGQEDEPLRAAAQRELVEETGYEAGGFVFLTEGPISAGITDEILTFYLATELKKVADGGGEGAEEIVVHEVPLRSAREWLERMRENGRMVDPKVYTGLYFLSVDVNVHAIEPKDG